MVEFMRNLYLKLVELIVNFSPVPQSLHYSSAQVLQSQEHTYLEVKPQLRPYFCFRCKHILDFQVHLHFLFSGTHTF